MANTKIGTFGFADFSDLSNFVYVNSTVMIPAKAVITQIVYNITTPFDGAGQNAVGVYIGKNGDQSLALFNAGPNDLPNQMFTTTNPPIDFVNSSYLSVSLQIDDTLSLSDLTQGSMDIWAIYETLS